MLTASYIAADAWFLRPEWKVDRTQLDDDVQPIDAPEYLAAGSTASCLTSATREMPLPTCSRRDA